MSADAANAIATVGAMPLGIVSSGVAAAGSRPFAPSMDAPSQDGPAQSTGLATPPAAPAAAIVAPRAMPPHASMLHPPAQPSIGAAPSTAGAVGGTVFALLFVIALIFALAWLAKRMPGFAKASNPALKLVASLPLGPRERVVVVDVGGTQLLLGVGAGGTRALHTLEAPLPMPEREKLNVPPFAQLLAQHFGKKS